MHKDEMLKDNPFGRLLESLHVRKGWTQEDAAAHLGIARGTYSAWVRGKRLPSPEQLKHIAAVFKLSQADADELYRVAAQVPPKIDNLPSLQNPFFTGRTTQLEELRQRLQEDSTDASPRIICISGLAGMGKTQLALEYAHRYYPTVYRAVLWVNASDGMTLQASYDTVAKLLDLPEQHERESGKRVQAVKEWLVRHTAWLLVMDNADDLPLARSFLPAKPSGHIIFTTRSQIVRDRGIAAQVQVEEMEPEEGLRFLLRRTGKLEKNRPLNDVAADVRKNALQLVEQLGGHPLALDQAGAYIEETDTSFSEYSTFYQIRRRSLLERRKEVVSEYADDGEHPQSVVVTFELCFEMAQKRHPLATDILRFCAFLQPDTIPEELFQYDDSFKLDTLAFNDIMIALRRYSLVKRNVQEQMLSMHRLVQTVVADGILPHLRKVWRNRVVRALHTSFPEVDFSQWDKCSRLVAHALVCAAWQEEEFTPIVEAAELFHRAGTYLDERAQYAEAELLLTRAIAIRERCLGHDHPDIAQSLNNLGWLYDHEGKYKEAESMHQRALAMREKHMGLEHPTTAQSLNNLAVLYRHQLKYTEAEPLHRRALAIREKQLGPEHIDTAESLNNLGLLYSDMKRYEEAEPLLKRSLTIREKLLGTEHPDVAESLNNLAFLYDFQEKYAASEPMHTRALAIREKHLGPDHPNVAQSLTNLAWLYDKLQRYEEAELLFQRTLAIDIKTCGPEHPYVADDIYNLAVLYHKQRNYELAETYYQRALAIQERQLGTTHQYAQDTRKKYAELLQSLGRDAEAAALEANDAS